MGPEGDVVEGGDPSIGGGLEREPKRVGVREKCCVWEGGPVSPEVTSQ